MEQLFHSCFCGFRNHGWIIEPVQLTFLAGQSKSSVKSRSVLINHRHQITTKRHKKNYKRTQKRHKQCQRDAKWPKKRCKTSRNRHREKPNDYKETQSNHKETQSDLKETQTSYCLSKAGCPLSPYLSLPLMFVAWEARKVYLQLFVFPESTRCLIAMKSLSTVTAFGKFSPIDSSPLVSETLFLLCPPFSAPPWK